MRLFRKRKRETDVVTAVSAAVGQPVEYNHLQYGAGALSGVVDAAGPERYAELLRAAYTALREELGDDADRVVFYLSAVTPDGTSLDATSLGLPVQPTGEDVARL